jgi:ubiquinone/menaquinone biosynthesis C-methylase UbiE
MSIEPEINQPWWDERAALHGQDAVYDTAGFLDGRSTLYRLDHELVGEVAGRHLIHLQCHTGMDTLSWLRAGAARVTGVDFSSVALARAAEIAAKAGLADRASFVQADVLAVPEGLHGQFDICYASRGVVGWIGDIDAWMRTAAAVLRPGGHLVLIEMHPLFAMADSVNPLRLDFPYVNDGPRTFTETGSYAAPDAKTVHNTTVQFAHSVGEVITAAVHAGLLIEHVGEHVEVETDVGRGLLRPEADGLVRWRVDTELLPVLYSLRARKPE